MQSLAVKYRPTEFIDVLGDSQAIVCKILQKQIEKEEYKNCYLFAGETGSGKTSIARIFANKINKGVGAPIEIDGAVNNGVDNVRAIVDSANQRSLTGEYKIFIIDEAHAITTAGWQAFLKGIEEPPLYTIFIFCTTEPNKIPGTVLNRLQRYNIAKVSQNIIKQRLLYICQQEGFTNYEATCDLISRSTHGCMRDSITYLEQCASYSTDLSLNIVGCLLSGLSTRPMFALTWALQDRDEGQVINIIDQLFNTGVDLKNFINTYLELVLDLIKFKLFNDINITNIPENLAAPENPVVQQTLQIDNCLDWLNRLVEILLDIKLAIRYDTSYNSTILAYLIKFCRG